MFAVNPVKLLIKPPLPVPLVVGLLSVVGFAEVLQQMPRAVTAAPPSAVTLPPPVAVVWVMAVMAVVVTVGKPVELKVALKSRILLFIIS